VRDRLEKEVEEKEREKYYIKNGSGKSVEEGRDRWWEEKEMELINKEREMQRQMEESRILKARYCYAWEQKNSRFSVLHSLRALSFADAMLTEMKWYT